MADNERTPQQAQDLLDNAFAQAFDNGFRVDITDMAQALEIQSSVAWDAATSILQQMRPNRRWDFRLKNEDNRRFARIIQRQTERNR